MIEIRQGDCREVLAELEAESFSACVTDPPYHLTTDKKGGTGVASLNVNSPAGRSRISTGFMGTIWDGGDVAFQPETWVAVYRVLKPGAHLLAFGGTRTYHRLVCAIEDAGFEIRDTIMWLYGSGFPKSHDVSRALDRAAGAEREVVGVKASNRPNVVGSAPGGSMGGGFYTERLQTSPATAAAREWQGWGTALKPAAELICVARKPSAAVPSDELHDLTGWDHWCSSKSDGEDKIVTARALHPETRSYRARIDKYGREIAREDLGAYDPFEVDAVAANVLRHGTGALNIDACRVDVAESDAKERSRRNGSSSRSNDMGYSGGWNPDFGGVRRGVDTGRWPANVCHDGSPEVLGAFSRFGEHPSGGHISHRLAPKSKNTYGDFGCPAEEHVGFPDGGTAARFFFCAKADASERVGSHPTVKPVALMEWLVQLVTPAGGRVLDPFAGTGSTLVACDRLGFDALGIEQDAQTVADAHEKLLRMRARRMIGNAERVPVVAGQLGLFE